jgi:hypothetical protein
MGLDDQRNQPSSLFQSSTWLQTRAGHPKSWWRGEHTVRSGESEVWRTLSLPSIPCSNVKFQRASLSTNHKWHNTWQLLVIPNILLTTYLFCCLLPISSHWTVSFIQLENLHWSPFPQHPRLSLSCCRLCINICWITEKHFDTKISCSLEKWLHSQS